METGNRALKLPEWRAYAEQPGTLVLDVRPPGEFARGFVPRAVNIGLKGDFAPWVGSILVDVNQPLVLVCTPGEEAEALTRLSRVGFDRVLGYLEGGFDAWLQAGLETDRVDRIPAGEMVGGLQLAPVVDVRKPSEFESGHVQGASSFPLADIASWFSSMPEKGFFFLHCAGGYRSMIAASVLKRRGIHNFREIDGGYNAIAKTPVPLTLPETPVS
jgi:rhodanese-related sulfurtransferase